MPRQVAIYRADLLPRSETFVYEQARALQLWKPTLIGNRLLKGGLSLEGVQTTRLGVSACIPSLATRKVRRLGSELVHVHFGTDLFGAWKWLSELHIPILTTLHGFDIMINEEWWSNGRAGNRYRGYPSGLRSIATSERAKFIAVSESIRAEAINKYGLRPESVIVHHIGVDVEKFKPFGRSLALRDPTILFVGRLVPKKAPIVLIRAMAIVQRSVPKARALLIGDGPLRAELEKAASDLGSSVQFFGAGTSSDVLNALSNCAVFCLPSVRSENGDAEGLPISLLEAQACGIPVVTSAIGGRDEGMVRGVTGEVFDEWNHEQLAQILISMLSDRARLAAYGSAAIEFVRERFDIRTQCAALEEIYASVADAQL